MDGRHAAVVLGVSPGATKRQVVRAFRARAKTAHPDASGSDEAFIELRAAFETLHLQAPDEPDRCRVSPASPFRQPAVAAPTLDLSDIRPTPRATVVAPPEVDAAADRAASFAVILDTELARRRPTSWSGR